MKGRSRSSSTPTRLSKQSSIRQVPREKWSCARALRELRSLGEQRNIDGMAQYGIRAKVAYGVAKPKMDELARRIGRDHELALELWGTRSEEHTSELQSPCNLVCRLLLEKKKKKRY